MTLAHPRRAERAPRRRARDDGQLRKFAATRSPRLREEVVASYMPLARSLAMRYRGGSESSDDLVQVATLGLIKAVDRFDPDRGRPFTAFAVPTILGELRRHFRDHVWNLRLPRGLQEMTAQVDAAVDELTEELGRVPRPAQIAARLGLSTEQILETIAASQARRTLSLDAPVRGEDGPMPTLDTISSTELGFERVESEFASQNAELSERELRVLRLRVVDGLAQHEIGKSLGVSQMQISRIQRSALSKLLSAVRGDERHVEA